MTPSGWYADPSDPLILRYWDGAAWTSHISPGMAQPDGIENHLRRVGERVVVSASDVVAGLVPAQCVPHHRTGSTVRVKFASKAPMWIYFTLVFGVIVTVIIAALLRKTVTAQAWPVCDECEKDRRKNLLWSWVSIGSWLPAFFLYSILPWDLGPGIQLVLLTVVVLGPLIVAVWFADRASKARGVSGEVSSDGLTVSFPARAFPLSLASAASSPSPR